MTQTKATARQIEVIRRSGKRLAEDYDRRRKPTDKSAAQLEREYEENKRSKEKHDG